MTPGPAARLLTPTLTSANAVRDGLMTQLRAALNGSGPALLLMPEGHDWGAVPLTDDDPTDPVAVGVTTSGSTGAAKTVLLPASALLASAAATHDRLGGAGRWLLTLPVHHVAGLQVLVRSLVAGTTPVVADPGTFTAAGFVALAASMTGARRYTALVPTQVTRLLNAPDGLREAALEALRGFDAVLVGGAAVPTVLRERAAAAGIRLVTTYGMSETSGGCVYGGQPLDGVEVRIDPEGRVWLSGPTLARGYLDDPDATARAFRTDDDGRRWFRTDDAGTLEDAGARLRIHGRLDQVIITGGVNVAPGPVEAVLQRLPGVAEAVVVGLPDPQWGQRVAAALVLAPGADPPTLAEVRALVSDQVSAPAAPRQLTLLDHLPLRGPGKPDRTAIETVLASRPPLEGI